MKNSPETEPADIKILFLCFVMLIGIAALDLFIPLGVAAGVPYTLVVLVSLWSPRRKLPIYVAIVGSGLTIIGFYFSPYGGELWQVISNRALALFVIWVTAILSVQRRQFLEEKVIALSKVKVLHGLLPICATCKKIRNDSGYWSQIETYIRDHSEADFSHGLCPECARKLYPDLYNEIDGTV